MAETPSPDKDEQDQTESAAASEGAEETRRPAPEVRGPKGPEPTRYGDWERQGIASDF